MLSLAGMSLQSQLLYCKRQLGYLHSNFYNSHFLTLIVTILYFIES